MNASGSHRGTVRSDVITDMTTFTSERRSTFDAAPAPARSAGPFYDGVDPNLPWQQRVNQPNAVLFAAAAARYVDPAWAAGGAHFADAGTVPQYTGRPAGPSFTTSRSAYAITNTPDPAQAPGGVQQPAPDELAGIMASFGLVRR